MKIRQLKKIYKKLNLHKPDKSAVKNNGEFDMNFELGISLTYREWKIAYKYLQVEKYFILYLKDSFSEKEISEYRKNYSLLNHPSFIHRKKSILKVIANSPVKKYLATT